MNEMANKQIQKLVARDTEIINTKMIKKDAKNLDSFIEWKAKSEKANKWAEGLSQKEVLIKWVKEKNCEMPAPYILNDIRKKIGIPWSKFQEFCKEQVNNNDYFPFGFDD